ncbi:hypothetical protein So717_17770 [Roseobacter cerasinus]|uniref:Beta-lactamase-related domain-containing protein n=1 Tax=Roseobacter cerasinus TaxID=2602289 RepID=A0A640VQZ0_9RHOB|nr:serine hydrolase domain-containing protein [Roseobacter cerasinus]GFE50024.1 hypothetical protein So717_17770 [Roseobacter cerasinus]
MSTFTPAAPDTDLDAFDRQKTAPAALMEIARGGLSITDARGVEDTETGDPVTTDHQFQIGSQVGMMVGVLVLDLVAEGPINFDAPMSAQMDVSALPEIANIDTVTMHQLLSNHSGILDYDTVPGDGDLPAFIELIMDDPPRPLGPDEILAIATGEAASFAPGEAYEYPNTNFLLLQKLIEQVTGQDHANVLKEKIYDPAGMTDSIYGVHSGSGRSFILPHLFEGREYNGPNDLTIDEAGRI